MMRLVTTEPSYGISQPRIGELMERERRTFAHAHPRSRSLFDRSRHSLLGGVPMHWMAKWPGGFPVVVEEANGAHFTCVDGHEYVDLCLGDTGALTGHGPAASIAAISAQLRRGMTTMLPTEDAPLVGEELTRRFGLPYWQFALTATDANRFALRLARHITGRTTSSSTTTAITGPSTSRSPRWMRTAWSGHGTGTSVHRSIHQRRPGSWNGTTWSRSRRRSRMARWPPSSPSRR